MRHLAPFLALLALVGCGPAPGVPAVDPSAGPVAAGPRDADWETEPPDELTKQLAGTGINVALALVRDLPAYGQLTTAYYAGREQREAGQPPAGAPAGWTFRQGFYFLEDAAADRRVKARFETEAGLPPAWDILLAANYEPELGHAFPPDLIRVRAEVESALPTGGRFVVTFVAPLAKTGRGLVEAFGSGSVTVPAPMNGAAFEALNARLKPTGEVEIGDLVLKALARGQTLQFSGQYGGPGLLGYPQILRNGKRVADVTLEGGGWGVLNKAGRFPL